MSDSTDNFINNKLKIERFIDDREILILIGPRRSGKTTIIYQLIDSLLQSGTSPKNILYISLDDPEMTLDMGDDLFIRLFESYQEVILRQLKDEKIYIFIDEVQYFKGWEMWLKKYFDQYPNIKFIVSGSSSLAIKDESAALTGRNLRFLIYPFSYREFIRAKDNILIEKTAFSYENFEDAYNAALGVKNKLVLLFQEYLHCGGYPRTHELIHGLDLPADDLQEYTNQAFSPTTSWLYHLLQSLGVASEHIPFFQRRYYQWLLHSKKSETNR